MKFSALEEDEARQQEGRKEERKSRNRSRSRARERGRRTRTRRKRRSRRRRKRKRKRRKDTLLMSLTTCRRRESLVHWPERYILMSLTNH